MEKKYGDLPSTVYREKQFWQCGGGGEKGENTKWFIFSHSWLVVNYCLWYFYPPIPLKGRSLRQLAIQSIRILKQPEYTHKK